MTHYPKVRPPFDFWRWLSEFWDSVPEWFCMALLVMGGIGFLVVFHTTVEMWGGR